MIRGLRPLSLLVPFCLVLAGGAAGQSASVATGRALPEVHSRCPVWERPALVRNPTRQELRCRYGVSGPGRFGLSEYMDVPVYQPATPLPGTHTVGVEGMPAPRPGESFEAWEWRVLRTEYAPERRRAQRELELLDPIFAGRLLEFERLLREAGVRFHRRETWRAPERQAYLFQQGRSRPGPMITATLTSWHSRVDARGAPASRAADYDVPRSQLPRFHEVAWAARLESYGPESNDPGHVYLAGEENFDATELALLRLLPRVPVVTIATGRPTDQEVSRLERASWRQAAAEWASEPFYPHPLPRLAAHPRRVAALTAPVLLPERPAEEVAGPAKPRGLLQALFRRRDRR